MAPLRKRSSDDITRAVTTDVGETDGLGPSRGRCQHAARALERVRRCASRGPSRCGTRSTCHRRQAPIGVTSCDRRRRAHLDWNENLVVGAAVRSVGHGRRRGEVQEQPRQGDCRPDELVERRPWCGVHGDGSSSRGRTVVDVPAGSSMSRARCARQPGLHPQTRARLSRTARTAYRPLHSAVAAIDLARVCRIATPPPPSFVNRR